MWAAGGGGFAVLTIVGILIRAAILSARANQMHQIAERRHQETLAALRSRRTLPTTPAVAPRRPAPAARPVVPPASTAPRPTRSPRPATPARVAPPPGLRDALPERAIVEAARLIVPTQYCTPAMLQRRMGVERETALLVLEQLERRGVIAPNPPHALPMAARAVLVPPDGLPKLLAEWAAKYGAP